jgi:small subunit ribosomal protein S4
MGYPGKNHKKYDTPKRRFEKSRIEDEAKLVIEYGLRNKRELWKAQSNLRRYRGAARELLSLVAAATDEALVERKRGELLLHLQRFGLLGDNATIDGVLALKAENELERRLQTLVYRRGLARSPKQARQFITHGHIAIKGRKVTIPSYRVSKEEEGTLSYYGLSPLTNDVHPERTRITKTGGR